MSKILNSIIEVFKKNNNDLLDYNEIYEKMDKSYFGPNKRGKKGEKASAYRTILDNINIFNIDENYKPKKYCLKNFNEINQNQDTHIQAQESAKEKITFIELAEIVLEDTKKPMSPKEIWEHACQLGFDNDVNSKGKTPWATLGSILYTEIYEKKRKNFIRCNKRPAIYCLRKYYEKKDDIISNKKYYHYIFMQDEQPDFAIPNQRKIKAGFGNIKTRFAECRRQEPDAYKYRIWCHHKNIESDLLYMLSIFGKRKGEKGNKGEEVFLITQERLDRLIKHYDENVFDEVIVEKHLRKFEV